VAEVLESAGLVLDCLPRAIVIIDREGTIEAWNSVSTRFYGWTAQEAVGQSQYELITPPEMRELGRSIVERVLEGESWNGNVKVTLRGGDVVRTFSFLGPLRDADGAVVGAVCAADDHSQLRDLNEQTSALTDRLVLALAAGRLGTWKWDATTGSTTWDPMMEHLFGLEEGAFGGTFDEWVPSASRRSRGRPRHAR